ncbi:MAG: DUF4416 family protein [Spirochaetia bacterium]
MGNIQKFQKEKLIIGVLLSNLDEISSVKAWLIPEYGEIDYESEPLLFTYTKYYTKEMGTEIYRIFLSFKNLISPERLSDIKIFTNTLEQRFAFAGARKVNLDPGILNNSRLILASTKDNVQRVPLKKGIFAEITLQYMHGEFVDLFWTYPDYKSEEYKQILSEIRKKYSLQLKQEEK